MPVSCHFWHCKVLLVWSLTHVRSLKSSTGPISLHTWVACFCVAAVRIDVHGAELYHKVRFPAVCSTAWSRCRCTRHKSTYAVSMHSVYYSISLMQTAAHPSSDWLVPHDLYCWLMSDSYVSALVHFVHWDLPWQPVCCRLNVSTTSSSCEVTEPCLRTQV